MKCRHDASATKTVTEGEVVCSMSEIVSYLAECGEGRVEVEQEVPFWW